MKPGTFDRELTLFPTERIPGILRQFANTRPHGTAILPLDPSVLPAARQTQSSKMAIKADGKILFVNPTEIISVNARGNYVLLEKDSGSYVLRATLSEMISKLEKYGFIRIHRSLLVNSLFVEEMQLQPNGNYALRVRGGKFFMTSRTYKKNLNSLAESWVGAGTFVGD